MNYIVFFFLSCLVSERRARVSADRIPIYRDPEMGYARWLEHQDTLLTRSFAHTMVPLGLVRIIRIASGGDLGREEARAKLPELERLLRPLVRSRRLSGERKGNHDVYDFHGSE